VRLIWSVVLMFGCGSRAAPSQREAEAGPARDAAIARVADAAPPPEPCLTTADLQAACATDQTLTAHADEGQAGGPLCSRSVDDRASYSRFTVTVRRTDVADATADFGGMHKTRDTVRAVPVELGDQAELEHDHTAMESETISLRVRRGADLLILRQFRPDGGARVCTDEQLVELGRRALARLGVPSAP
jgi:hypothetical protein